MNKPCKEHKEFTWRCLNCLENNKIKSNLDKLREDLDSNKNLTIQQKIVILFWFKAQKKAILKDVIDVERKTTFVTGNIVSQEERERAYRNGYKRAFEKIKQLLKGDKYGKK